MYHITLCGLWETIFQFIWVSCTNGGNWQYDITVWCCRARSAWVKWGFFFFSILKGCSSFDLLAREHVQPWLSLTKYVWKTQQCCEPKVAVVSIYFWTSPSCSDCKHSRETRCRELVGKLWGRACSACLPSKLNVVGALGTKLPFILFPRVCTPSPEPEPGMVSKFLPHMMNCGTIKIEVGHAVENVTHPLRCLGFSMTKAPKRESCQKVCGCSEAGGLCVLTRVAISTLFQAHNVSLLACKYLKV